MFLQANWLIVIEEVVRIIIMASVKGVAELEEGSIININPIDK
jgi:hypothetical protein